MRLNLGHSSLVSPKRPVVAERFRQQTKKDDVDETVIEHVCHGDRRQSERTESHRNVPRPIQQSGTRQRQRANPQRASGLRRLPARRNQALLHEGTGLRPGPHHPRQGFHFPRGHHEVAQERRLHGRAARAVRRHRALARGARVVPRQRLHTDRRTQPPHVPPRGSQPQEGLLLLEGRRLVCRAGVRPERQGRNPLDHASQGAGSAVDLKELERAAGSAVRDGGDAQRRRGRVVRDDLQGRPECLPASERLRPDVEPRLGR